MDSLELGALTDQPIRVAMIGQKGYPPIHGGIEKHVAELASRLSAFGFDIRIYSRPHYSDCSGPVQDGLEVRRLGSIPTKHLDAISHSLLATFNAIPRSFDIVHYHALGPGLLSGLPRWLARKRTVVTVHGLDWQREKWGRLARMVLRCGEFASVHFPHRTIVVSQALQKYYREQHRRRTDYIPNGITPPVYRRPKLIRGLGIEAGYILFVGRLVPEKGCHLLVDAYARLPESVRREVPLVIAGGSGFTPDYVRKLQQGSGDSVRFLGYVHGPALEELYTNAVLVVLPSTLEGLSLSLLEGMSYGRCCLASDIPPNREAGAGYVPLFPSGDSQSLARVMERLLGDADARAQYGQRAQMHVIENYSWDHVAQQTAKLYRGLVAAGRKRTAAGRDTGGGAF